jgi:hypothetical protein
MFFFLTQGFLSSKGATHRTEHKADVVLQQIYNFIEKLTRKHKIRNEGR